MSLGGVATRVTLAPVALLVQNLRRPLRGYCALGFVWWRWSPCADTPRELFDYMGMSVRVKDWRYSTFCRWDGTRLAANWSACEGAELYNHSADTSLYDVDDNGEPFNLAGSGAGTAGVERELLGLLRLRFL